MFRSSNETRASRRLLQTAALGNGDSALLAWRAWRSGTRPWQLDPASEWWFPLVWWNLKDAAITKPDRAWLRRTYDETWIRNEHRLAVAGEAIATLERAGIETIVLKGAALALTAYARTGLRPFGDVDVLVKPARADAARRVLREGGWAPIRDVNAASLPLRHSLGYASARGVDLDLHWSSLLDCSGDAESDRGFWSRAAPLSLPGAETRALSPADQLLLAAVHGQRWSPVATGAWEADALMILRSAHETLRWDVLAAEARSRRLVLQVKSALDVLRQDHREAATLQPPQAMNALRDAPVVWWEILEHGAKRRVPTIGPLVVQSWCQAARRGHQWKLPRVMADVRAMADADGWWPLLVRGAARALGEKPSRSRTVSAYGRVIRIDADGEAAPLVDAGLARLPRFKTAARNDEPDRRYEISRVTQGYGTPGAAHYRVSANARLLATTRDPAEAARAVASDVQDFLVATAADATFVHAGVVGIEGRAIVLPGASRAGKSTLVTALLRAGATYFSDEFAIVNTDGTVEPFARSIVLRGQESERAISAASLGAPTAERALPAGLVVFTGFEEHGVFAPRRVSAGDAILRLLRHCPGAEARPIETMGRLRALTANAALWSTARGEADEAAAVILALAQL